MTTKFEKLERSKIRKLGGAWRQSKAGCHEWAAEKITEHGITAERLADGDVRWSVNVMVDGRRIHRIVGTEAAGVTRTQCEQFIETARTDARAGRLSLPRGRKIAQAFTAAAADYLKRLEEGAGKNVARKRLHLNKRLSPFFGSMRLDAVTSFTIDRYKKKRLGEGAANGTINRELATLSHLFSQAVEWKWIDRLPCRPKKLKEGQGRIVALTGDQCDALMRAAVASADPDCWLFVAFGLNTTMRHSEILAARFDQLDLDHLRLFIPDAKAGQREQPITPELAEMLRKERESREDRRGWIFPAKRKDSKTGHRTRMDRPFGAAVEAAGFDAELVSPHTMRHTGITALVQAGVDLPTVQRISGHKTLAMVMRYSHVHGAHIDRAMRAIGRTLPELQVHEPGCTITQELHTPAKLQAIPTGRIRTKSLA